MNLRKGQIIELVVESLAFGGRGIGSFEGMRIFVDGVMAGDKVRASLRKIKKNFAEANLVEIVEPSAQRVKPKCGHSGVCGGCQIQFMPYENQLAVKRQHVVDCFERIGGLRDVEVAEVLASPEVFYYRNKMEFSFGYDAEMKFTFGMHVPGRRFDIMDLTECHLESEASYNLVNAVRKFFVDKPFLPFRYSDGEGFLKGLIIREAKRTGQRMAILRTSEQVAEGFEEVLADFCELLKANGVDSGFWSMDISKRGQPRRVVEKHLFGPEVLLEKMVIDGEEFDFEVAPSAFFQVNLFQAEVLYSQVRNLVLAKPVKRVYDLFCGTGTIGLALARHVEAVVGIELNEEAVKVARENARRNGIENIEFIAGDVGKVLKEKKEQVDLIVIDPPRAGLQTEKVVAMISEFGCERIVYVSCDPATLARDCKWFAEFGYRVVSVQPVDMFPHTFHIENVCLLEKV